ncbi:MAG: glycosyltransferase family 4 protein [Candidatus Nanopelagicales bacterium]
MTTTDISLELLLGPQLEAFAAAGWNVIGASAPGEHVAALEARGIRHVPVEHLTRSMDLRADLLAARELYRLFKDLKPDVVHTHNPKPGWIGRPAARVARVPAVVNTVHGLYAQPTDGLALRSVVRVLERGAATCSHAELIQNHEDTATLARWGVPAERVVDLGNGIDLSRFDRREEMADERRNLRAELGVPDGTPVVVTVGRLVAEKGFRELFEVHRRLRRSGSDHVLVVVGPTEAGKADGLTQSEVADATADGVRLVGFSDRPERYYAAADVFVLASHREGFPRAAMEASAMGLPVIATDIRGCRQVVDDGVTGLLVRVKDTDALEEGLRSLLDDHTRSDAMGKAAAQRARDNFDQREQIELTLGTYRRLLPEIAPS